MAKVKGGLGKGLGALIPASSTPHKTEEVDIDLILPNPRQPRQDFASLNLQELAESIREHGIIQPLVVAEAEGQTGGSRIYQLIAGERRWRAARLAGLSTVPIVVKEATSQQSLEIALVENIQRADLSPLEEAAAYHQLVHEFGLTQEEIALRVGKSRSTIANALRLLNLPEAVKAALNRGAISEGHARALLGLPAASQQLIALDAVIAKNLNVRQTEELVRAMLREPVPSPVASTASDPETTEIEDRFRSALGTKVQLLRAKKGGKLVIHFYSEEELQGLYEAIIKD